MERVGHNDGVIVIRVWFEDHPDFPLRAVVTTITDKPDTEIPTTAVKSADEICSAIRSALDLLSDSVRSDAMRRTRE